MQGHNLHTVSKARLATDKQVEKTGISTISTKIIFSYVLWSIERPCQQSQSSSGLHTD